MPSALLLFHASQKSKTSCVCVDPSNSISRGSNGSAPHDENGCGKSSREIPVKPVKARLF